VSSKGRPVLVTGAGGFIGSHLVERLLGDGAEVRALCEYSPTGSRGWLDRSPLRSAPGLSVRQGDVRDARYVEELCRGVEVVYHLAALVSIPHSYEAPSSTFATNAGGTLNVLEGVRRAGCKRMVFCSTSEVYGTPETVPIRETHPLRAQSPYSASKIAAEKLCESYALSFATPVVVVRPFNTYGPRQSARAVIPTILAQLLAGERRVRLGNVSPRRDLTFVEDTALGLLLAGEAPLEPAAVVQLGSGEALSVKEIFEAATRVLSVEAEIVSDPERVRPRASEVEVLLSDPSRAHERLGWAASVRFEEGLRRTADWLRENLDLYRPGDYAR
jgi:UDP-glucose 4-epimerase